VRISDAHKGRLHLGEEMKLTPWFPPSIAPVRIGEYNASIFRDDTVRRWWDGVRWSQGYEEGASEKVQNRNRNLLESFSRGMHWRGLAEEPK